MSYCVWVDTFERLANLVRSITTFSPIYQIPSEVFSLIPGYLNDECGTGLVTLTHVCCAWREIFISHSSLWAPLNCRDVHKTLTY